PDVVADDQERHATRVVGEEVTGLRELRGVSDEQREAAKQRHALAFVARRIDVRAHRLCGGMAVVVSGAVLEMREYAPDQLMLQLVLHGSPPEMGSRPARGART